MWFLFASLAGLFFTVDSLIARHVLKGRSDPWAYSFYFSAVGAIVTFPVMLADPVVPRDWQPWALSLLLGFLIVAANFCIFQAASALEASLVGALGKLKLVWVFLFGILLLGATFSWQEFLGVVCAVAAGIVVVGHVRRPEAYRGVVYMVLATIGAAAIILVSKYLFEWFNTGSLTFFASFLPAAIINLLLMPNARQRIGEMFRTQRRPVVLACFLGALANLSLNHALSLGEASAVLVVMETFLVLTWVGEHTVLKEKESPVVKLLAVILAIAGAILIQLNV